MKKLWKSFREFFKKYGNKIFWLTILLIWSYNIYNWFKTPEETWARVQENLQNPYYYIPLVILGMLILIVLIVSVVDRIWLKPMLERKIELLEALKDSIKKSAEETEKLKSGEIPSDEEIEKYYKMYCKKFELDNRDQWTTRNPMPFEEWEKEAKTLSKDDDLGDGMKLHKRGGWEFMIAQTSDAFTFDPKSGISTMMRYTDYESMIDEETINKQLDIE